MFKFNSRNKQAFLLSIKTWLSLKIEFRFYVSKNVKIMLTDFEEVKTKFSQVRTSLNKFFASSNKFKHVKNEFEQIEMGSKRV